MDHPRASTEPASIASIAAAGAKARTNPWILSPAIDLIFCCGGFLWFLVFEHFLLGFGTAETSANAAPIVFLGVIGALVFADSHNIATLKRLFGDGYIRSRLPHIAYWATAAFILLAGVSMFQPLVLGIVLRVYLLFIAQHLTAQIYGISLIYCGKRGYAMAPGHRVNLQRALQSLAVLAVVREFYDPDLAKSTFQGITLPSWGLLPEWTIALALIPLLVYGYLFMRDTLQKQFTQGETLPFPVVMLLLTTVMLFTTAALELKVIWLYVPAFFHGVQYLVITTAVRLKQSGADLSRGGMSVMLLLFEDSNLRYWGSLLFMAVCLYLAIPGLCTVFGVKFEVAFASVFAAVSLHHFLADSAIWRMRDPEVRKLLI